MEVFLFIAVFMIALAIIGRANLRASKKRTEDFEQQAGAMGLQFTPDGSHVQTAFEAFNLMTIGRSKQAKNLISGDAGDVKISIFDYQYTTGGGKSTRTTIQTVVALESDQITAPAFSMRQQSAIMDRIGKFFGGQDIDFEGFPTFSEMFVLKGPNEEAIRRFFTPSLLTYFETKVGHCVEGAHGKMILYKAGNRTEPEAIKDLLASAYEVYGHIVDQE